MQKITIKKEEMSKRKNLLVPHILGLLVIFLMSSCSLTLPRFSKNTTGVTVTNNSSQIEPLKRGEYTTLRTTTGKASTTRCYILFIPIGKHKTNRELFDNAYYAAVENLPDADALILPRQETKKLTIPLLLFNYNKRTTTVTGVGVSVKDKLFENTETNVPYKLLRNYNLKPGVINKKVKKYKITSKQEFEKYFELSSSLRNEILEGIDFSNQYAIAVIGKATKKSVNYSIKHLRLKGSTIELSYNIDMGEKQEEKRQPYLVLVVDKEYQGEIVLD
jgi:hypothetical protein